MEDVLWHKAERAAKDLDRTASWVIREALEAYLDRLRAGKLVSKDPQGAGVYVVQLDPQAAKVLESVAQTTGSEASELIRIAVNRFLDRREFNGA
jgi:predicted transcriptional regulator